MSDSGSFAWPGGATMAASLAYLGALPEHIEIALPALRERGLRATFFVSPTRLLDNPAAWRKVADEGHEIANHSLDGVTIEGRLDNWTLQMVADDLDSTQKLLREVVGRQAESFALPGRDPVCSEGPYVGVVRERFEFVLSTADRGAQTMDADLGRLRSLDLAELTETSLQAWLSTIRSVPDVPSGDRPWSIVTFGHISNSSALLASHDRILQALAEFGKGTLTAPIREIGRHILDARSIASA